MCESVKVRSSLTRVGARLVRLAIDEIAVVEKKIIYARPSIIRVRHVHEYAIHVRPCATFSVNGAYGRNFLFLNNIPKRI